MNVMLLKMNLLKGVKKIMSEIIIKTILMIGLFISMICYFYAAKKENKKMEVVGLVSIITSLVFAYAAK